MDQTARTMGKVLESANVQIAVLTKTVEAQAEQTHNLLEFIREMNVSQAMRTQESSDSIAALLSGAQEYVPTLLNLLVERMAKKPTPPNKVVAIGGSKKE